MRRVWPRYTPALRARLYSHVFVALIAALLMAAPQATGARSSAAWPSHSMTCQNRVARPYAGHAPRKLAVGL